MVPISLAVTLLEHYGILSWLASHLNPLFVHLGLPGSSALAFISGAAAGTYSGIAAMMSMPLTMREATILGIMIALCHSLPMECSINRRTGSSFWGMGLIRILAAFACAYYLNLVLPDLPSRYISVAATPDSTLLQVLTTWTLSQFKMAIMLFAIVYGLMVLQKSIEAYRLLTPLSHFFAPLMTLFGLPRRSAYMWLVGNILGISYGAAVMVELEEKGIVSREDANTVNHHLVMSHSMLEDTLVFAATGISTFWIISTRLLFAFVLVWARHGFLHIVHTSRHCKVAM